MSVTLIDHLGSDLSIVNAARVSLGKRSDELSDADRGLIGYLMRNRHGTPFEMVVFQFHAHVPIGVGREWLRHRIGSFNEISTRYVEMEPDFYVPDNEAMRTQTGKPGHYTFGPLNMVVSAEARLLMRRQYEQIYITYQTLLQKGVAKEVARNVLPLGLMTQFYWTVNLRSLFNFLSLRTAPTALLEIRREAEEVERLIEPVVPVALAAWREQGKIAP